MVSNINLERNNLLQVLGKVWDSKEDKHVSIVDVRDGTMFYDR